MGPSVGTGPPPHVGGYRLWAFPARCEISGLAAPLAGMRTVCVQKHAIGLRERESNGSIDFPSARVFFLEGKKSPGKSGLLQELRQLREPTIRPTAACGKRKQEWHQACL